MGKAKEDETIDWGAIKAAIVGGEPFRAVARRYGLSASTISMRSTRQKWKIREMRAMAEGPAEVEMGVVEAPEEWRREAAMMEVRAEVAEHRASQFSASLAVKGSSARVLKRIMGYVETLSVEEILAQHRAIVDLIKAAGGLFRWQAEEPATTDGRLIAPVVNLALIRTSPEQLRAMAKARGARGARVRPVETGTAQPEAEGPVGAVETVGEKAKVKHG